MKNRNINSEAVVYGAEPLWNITFKTEIEKDVALMRAATWYRNMSDTSQHKKWFLEYCKTRLSKEDYQKITSISDPHIRYGDTIVESLKMGFNAGIYARLINLGAPVGDKIEQTMRDAISYFLDAHQEKIDTGETDVDGVAIVKEDSSIQDRINVKSSNILNFVECLIDETLKPTTQISNKLGFTVENEKTLLETMTAASKKVPSSKKVEVADSRMTWIANMVSKPVYCKKVKEHCESVFKEITSTDAQIVEAYAIYDAKNLSNLKTMLSKIIDICDTQQKVSKFVKPRKRKTKSPVDLVKKLKYQAEDTETGIKSVSPTKIVGASKFVLYNTKYHAVTVLEANGPDGLTVKGKTILGFDDKKSYTKKIRKPKDFFKSVESKGIRAFKSAIDNVKTKTVLAKGRINEHTILYGDF